MTRVLLDQPVSTVYGHFALVWDDEAPFEFDLDVSFAGQVNGLVGAARPGGVRVQFPEPSDSPRVCILRHDDEPDPPEPRYEDVVEVSFVVPAGVAVGWQSWAGENGGPLDVSAGSYRLRMSCHVHRGETLEPVAAAYLLEVWPAPTSPDAVVRVGSEQAAYWHRRLAAPPPGE